MSNKDAIELAMLVHRYSSGDVTPDELRRLAADTSATLRITGARSPFHLMSAAILELSASALSHTPSAVDDWQRKGEGASRSEGALDAHAASMRLDDTFCDCETKSGASYSR